LEDIDTVYKCDRYLENVGRNRLSSLGNGRAQAVAVGDLAAVVNLDAEIEQTRKTIEQLELAKASK
jgi:hypothetical protein